MSNTGVSIELAATIIGIIATIITVVVMFSKLQSSKSHETEEKAKEKGESNTMLKIIRDDVHSIGVKLDANHDIALEALHQSKEALDSAKRAHERIDKMEKK